ncbi:MAG: DNA topoisomerase 3 [Lachnospiraceae bacterium]|nr:DNA topoisomerase 3 [Lachnospiraceae bacterium]
MQLVIAEKPSVAQNIAAVLGANNRKNGYLEGNGYIISWCFGHLVELASPEAYNATWKQWSLETLPLVPDQWQYDVKESCAEQYNIIESLMNDNRVTETVCATDAGREGELIFRLVYDRIGCSKPIKRLWVSSMEESAIREGFDNLRPGEDYNNLYKAAVCRQQADWLVGINGTRLFTTLYCSPFVLNVGRITPATLAILVDRETAISNFTKEPFYTVHLITGDIDAISEKYKDKSDAEKVEADCKGASASISSLIKEEKIISPPKLYDMTTLQRDANRLFGYTAKQTLECTQSLYEKKLVTYPRTDSQYLSNDMGETATNVINAVLQYIMHEDPESVTPDISRVMNSEKVSDHHAIIPTMEITKFDMSTLPGTELKILFLIANRLMCATGEKHVYESVKVEISCGGHIFTALGKTIIKNGWKDFEERFRKDYKADKEEKEDEKSLPEISEGMIFDKTATKVVQGFTQPPKHFTEDSLLSAMERAGADEMDDDVERKGLGTTATRADIIEKLINGGFVVREKKQLLPTEIGIKLISILPEVVKSPKLTADWENKLVLVSKGEMKADVFMDGIVNMVNELIRDHSTVDEECKDFFARPQESIGICPKCGGNIISGKFGAYCQNKCGMNVGRVRGVSLSEAQVKSLLSGKKILVKGLKSKEKGTVYDAYFVPEGIEPYSYTSKDGKEITGFQFKIKIEFPERKQKKGGK